MGIQSGTGKDCIVRGQWKPRQIEVEGISHTSWGRKVRGLKGDVPEDISGGVP
jgi:hypothetical protein